MRKISGQVEDGVLFADMERYRGLAIETLGATDARIITTDAVLIDERVRMKCSYPKCTFNGTNAHCPPHAPDLEEMRRVVSKYRYALFTRIEVPADEFAGPAMARNGSKRGFMLTHELVSKLESTAFYDGYHFAMGFACGACKSVFCPTEPCAALVVAGTCRHPARARPSMECAGMDVFTMAARVGWDVYPIGGSARPSEIPCAASYGLVLIH
ncbi:MAG TPA: DUF2284 domain-containing protein [Polyangiaceae bacterium]